MTIGRAVALCLRNIGGQRAGETTKSVFGQPARFGFCIGEWEERSPWPSLAQRRGFAADEDVVTVHGGKGTFPMADIHNDDPRDLLYLIAKSIAYPLANMFLGNVGNGEVVVAFNPMWAERFGAAFPDVDDLHRVPARQRVAADRPVARGATPRCCANAGRVDSRGRVHLVERPDQIVPIVCGGLGSLHAIGLPSFGESTMQSKPVVRTAVTMDRDAVAAAVDELAGFLRADGADLLVREANPKTARVHLALVLDDVSCADCVLPPDELRETISDALQRRIAGRVRARARRPAPRSVTERGRDRRRRRPARELERARRACTSRCCTTSSPRSTTRPASTRACSPRSRTSSAPSRRTGCRWRAAARDAPALQPARVQPARAAHGSRRARRAPTPIPPTAGPRSS